MSVAGSITIARTRRGESWHVVKAGTFNKTMCGRTADRSTALVIDKPDPGIAYHPWQCVKCRKKVGRLDELPS